MYRVRYLEQTDKMSKHVHLSMVEEVYPGQLLQECAERSVKSASKVRRERHFTALSVLWFVLAMVLWSRLGQGRVWDKLTHRLQDRDRARPQEPAGASALSYQREQLGVHPLKQVFEQGTQVLCGKETAGAWYHGSRLMALDGSLFNLPDTAANEQAFGRSHNQAGKGAYPQARAVFLTECGSHATIALHLGRYDEAELHGAYALLPQVSRGMLLMQDANFFGGAYLEALNAKGVRALVALPSTVALKRWRNLPDGSYLARLVPNTQAVYPMQRALWVRVIEYQLTDERLGEPGQVYRLATTWLNPHSAPALALIDCYHERWEVEVVLDEIKTHQRLQQPVLRSRTPQGVHQEVYALLLAHYAVRTLMYQAAEEAHVDPDRLSFTDAVFVLSETTHELAQVLPAEQEALRQEMNERLTAQLLPERRLRANPRVLKKLYRKYKRKPHDAVPVPPFDPDDHFLDFVVLLL